MNRFFRHSLNYAQKLRSTATALIKTELSSRFSRTLSSSTRRKMGWALASMAGVACAAPIVAFAESSSSNSSSSSSSTITLHSTDPETKEVFSYIDWQANNVDSTTGITYPQSCDIWTHANTQPNTKGGNNTNSAPLKEAPFRLVGVGLRCMAGLCALRLTRAYTYGLYIDEDAFSSIRYMAEAGEVPQNCDLCKFKESMLTTPSICDKALRMVFVQPTKGSHISHGFDKSFKHRLHNPRHPPLDRGAPTDPASPSPSPSPSPSTRTPEQQQQLTLAMQGLATLKTAVENVGEFERGSEMILTWTRDNTLLVVLPESKSANTNGSGSSSSNTNGSQSTSTKSSGGFVSSTLANVGTVFPSSPSPSSSTSSSSSDDPLAVQYPAPTLQHRATPRPALEIASPLLCRAVFETYLGDASVAPAAQQQLNEAWTRLARPVTQEEKEAVVKKAIASAAKRHEMK